MGVLAIQEVRSCCDCESLGMKDALGGRDVGWPSTELSVINMLPRLWLSVKRSVPSWNSLKMI